MGTHRNRITNERDFSELLRRWNSHQTLRTAGAPIAVLADSRVELDEARDRVRAAA